MCEHLDADRYARLLQRIDPSTLLVCVTPLTGGVSATVVALDLIWGHGRRGKLVARQHGERDRARNPNVARDEFRLLQVAAEQGIVVPTPVYCGDADDLFPVPILVVAFVEGETDFAPVDLNRSLDQAATQLAQIHRLPLSDLAFLPTLSRELEPAPEFPDLVLGEIRIREALARVQPARQSNETVVLHGDYWPGNLLWRDGKLAAVIDWEDACLGDPLADLANSRLEVNWAFGAEAMRIFTERYCVAHPVDLRDLPYWDLRAAMKPCGKLMTWGLKRTTNIG